MTPTELKQHVAANVLNAMNCPHALIEARAPIVAKYLGVSEDGQVYVRAQDDKPLMTPCPIGSGIDVPYPIARLISELAYDIEPGLAWRLDQKRLPGMGGPLYSHRSF